MPLAASLQDIKDAVSAVSLYMTAPGNETEPLGEQWAYVGEAFFKNGLNPAWTPAGLSAGRIAFAQTFGTTLEGDPTGQALALAILGGFNSFGALASDPANATAVILIPPTVPPPAPPAPVTIPAPSNSTDPLAIEIYSKAIAWAPTGLVSIPNPAGVGPPVPTTPWS